ncbi:MAG: DUF4113 domain-containing protein [Alphaproteobacteria bacterium]|jgi:DNA polymerase V|nr:DUF4113 domain-containing protein [Alphaproteobacteria bacterium]OJV12562.1 MAG: hypothetical protein BGO27_03460 [Alphaproteobacteria bacterium 33-17]
MLLIPLIDIVPGDKLQLPLIQIDKPKPKLMNVLDEINGKFGRNTLFFAAQGINGDWQPQCTKKSPNYTTCWDDLIKVV